MKFKTCFLFLSGIIFGLLFSILSIWIVFICSLHLRKQNVKSITESAYGSFRNAISYATFFPFDAFTFERIHLPLAETASEAQPIIIHMPSEVPTVQEHFKKYRNKTLLIFTNREGTLVCLDFHTGEKLWQFSHELSLDHYGNHPLYDSVNGRIFFRSRVMIQSVDLYGKNSDFWRYDLAPRLKPHMSPNENIDDITSCHSSLALTQWQGKRAIVLGCSITSYNDRLSGYLLQFPIGSDGVFQKNKPFRFWPSAPVGKSPNTGYELDQWYCQMER